MKPRARLEVKVSMRVKDVVAIIDRQYGGMTKLRNHMDRHPDDQAAIALYTTADWHKDEPEEMVELGEQAVGDLADLLGAAKLDLIGQLMGHPGISLRQLARDLGKNPATVLQHVRDLEDAGLVVREDRGAGRAAVLRPTVTEIVIRVSAQA